MRLVAKPPAGSIAQETVPLRFPGSIGAEELTIATNQYRHRILSRIRPPGEWPIRLIESLHVPG